MEIDRCGSVAESCSHWGCCVRCAISLRVTFVFKKFFCCERASPSSNLAITATMVASPTWKEVDPHKMPPPAGFLSHKNSLNTRNPHEASCDRDQLLSELNDDLFGARNPHAGQYNIDRGLERAAGRQPGLPTPTEMDESRLIFHQWKHANGANISDFAKAKYTVGFMGKRYPLSDIRVWNAGGAGGVGRFEPAFHGGWKAGGARSTASAAADGGENGKGQMRLEFFFDGDVDFSFADGQEGTAGAEEQNSTERVLFVKSLEQLLRDNLQEGCMTEFRTRWRAKTSSAGGDLSRSPDASKGHGGAGSAAGGISTPSTAPGTPDFAGMDDDPFGDNLPAGEQEMTSMMGATDSSSGTQPLWAQKNLLNVTGFREGGCMIQFVVCRTTVSMQASRILGQQTFPDFFEHSLEDVKEASGGLGSFGFQTRGSPGPLNQLSQWFSSLSASSKRAPAIGNNLY